VRGPHDVYGVMAVNPGRWYCTVFALASPVPAADAALPSLMDALLCKSDFNAARTLRLEARAILVPRASGSQFAIRVSSGRGCSDQHPLHRFIQLQRRERLAMAALHLRPQFCMGAQLQLLYSAFRLPRR